MTGQLNAKFANNVYIKHPEFGVGVIRDPEVNALSQKAWIHFCELRLVHIPKSVPRKEWLTSDKLSGIAVLVYADLSQCSVLYLGIESGSKVNRNFIESASEYEHYNEIEQLDKFIYNLYGRLNNGMLSNTKDILDQIDDATIGSTYIMGQTARFGTEIIVPTDGTGIVSTAAYRCWYDWWDDHVECNLTPAQRQELDESIKNRLDYSHLKPRGMWKTESTLAIYKVIKKAQNIA